MDASVYTQSEVHEQASTDEKISSVRLEPGHCHLKRHRNTLAPVTRLHPEILGIIFVYAASVDHTSLRDVEPSLRFNFSFVSQQWRNVAVVTPEVWRILPDGYPSWARACLQRSRAVELVLNFSIVGYSHQLSRWMFLAEVMQDHFKRTQELGINFIKTSESQKILSALPASAPSLRILRVNYDGPGPMEQVPRICPKTLADAHLSTLELRGCTIDWSSSLFVGLRNLKIGPLITQPLPSELTHALCQMPDLETLEINNILLSHECSNVHQIKLFRLQTFRILSVVDSMASWLRKFFIPASAEVNLCCFAEYDSQGTLSDAQTFALAVSLAQFFNNLIPSEGDSLQYDSLRLSREATRQIAFAAWITPWPENLFWHRTDAPQFTLKIQGLRSVDSPMRYLLPVLPLGQLKTVSLMLGTSVEAQTILASFCGVANIKTIFLDTEVAPHIIRALSPEWDFSSVFFEESVNRILLFPQLQNLWFHRPLVATENPEINSFYWWELQRSLQYRVVRGLKLQSLILSDASGVGLEQIKLIAMTAEKIRWSNAFSPLNDKDIRIREGGDNLRLTMEDKEAQFEWFLFF